MPCERRQQFAEQLRAHKQLHVCLLVHVTTRSAPTQRGVVGRYTVSLWLTGDTRTHTGQSSNTGITTIDRQTKQPHDKGIRTNNEINETSEQHSCSIVLSEQSRISQKYSPFGPCICAVSNHNRCKLALCTDERNTKRVCVCAVCACVCVLCVYACVCAMCVCICIVRVCDPHHGPFVFAGRLSCTTAPGCCPRLCTTAWCRRA